jgi:hypothetical protein
MRWLKQMASPDFQWWSSHIQVAYWVLGLLIAGISAFIAYMNLGRQRRRDS